uniref:Uncharacterized protein n=1 Tax=Panagrolaimus superbus TaxID=310955 RepID=A0A914Z350_9BILA
MQFKASQRLRNPNEEHLNFDKRADTLSLEQANRVSITAEQDILQQQQQQPQLNINESVTTITPPQSYHPPTSVDILQQPVHRSIGDQQ